MNVSVNLPALTSPAEWKNRDSSTPNAKSLMKGSVIKFPLSQNSHPQFFLIITLIKISLSNYFLVFDIQIEKKFAIITSARFHSTELAIPLPWRFFTFISFPFGAFIFCKFTLPSTFSDEFPKIISRSQPKHVLPVQRSTANCFVLPLP